LVQKTIGNRRIETDFRVVMRIGGVSRSCPIAGLDVSGVEPSGSVSTMIVFVVQRSECNTCPHTAYMAIRLDMFKE
jgi:hypothetical protein